LKLSPTRLRWHDQSISVRITRRTRRRFPLFR
jgi:hypothetical protein